MKKWILLLSALLGVQVILILAIHMSGKEYQTFQATEKLFSFDPQTIDDIRIEDGSNSVALVKLGGGWVLPNLNDYPADEETLNNLLNKLSNMVKGWPVATTRGAAARFKVSEQEFERKLTMRSNDETKAELYLGTSPGFRKIHIRPVGSDDIHAVEFNAYEAPTDSSGWIDKKRLVLTQDAVAAIEMPGFTLQQKKADVWIMPDFAENERIDLGKAKEFIDRLTGLQILSVLGPEAKPEYLQDKPVLEFTVKRRGGGPLAYVFSLPEGESNYVLKRSDMNFFFKVAQFTVKPLLDAKREDLVRVLTPEELAAEQAAEEEAKETAQNATESASEEQVPAEEAPAEQAAPASN